MLFLNGAFVVQEARDVAKDASRHLGCAPFDWYEYP
jgi:hypothetical protein